MEQTSVEALLIDGEWESLCGMFNFENELENAMDTLDPSSFYNGHHHRHHDQNHAFCSGSNVLIRDDHHFNGLDKDVNVSLMEEGNNVGVVMSSLSYDPSKENRLKRKLDIVDRYTRSTNSIGSSDVTGKKLRAPRQGNGSCKRVGRSKKNQKVMSPESNNVNEDNNSTWTDIGDDHNQNLMNNYSSDDENPSQDTNIVTDLKGKMRASKGTATDPQSLYARKRRERINERLKILQNLVPNGTKVDISTMLEEAVHYVKFLQLQIKLLSSDDLWMYAPLAYNGVDMGLHQRLFSRLL